MKRTVSQIEEDWIFWRRIHGAEWASRRRARIVSLFARELSIDSLMADEAMWIALDAIAEARVTSAIEVSQ